MPGPLTILMLFLPNVGQLKLAWRSPGKASSMQRRLRSTAVAADVASMVNRVLSDYTATSGA